MAKIPVGKTIAYAYGFTFGNFLTIFGLIWFPIVLMLLPSIFLARVYFASFAPVFAAADPAAALASVDPGAFAQLALLWPITMILTLAGTTMMLEGVTRQALGMRTGPAFFYFNLGTSFWTVIASVLVRMLLTFGITIAAMVLSIIAVAILGFLLAFALGALAGAAVAGAAAMLFIFAAIFYVATSLWFFALPIAVAEERIGIRRGWELTKGNFWRIVLIGAVIVLPLMVIVYAIMFGLLFATDFPPLNSANGEVTQEAMREWFARSFQSMRGFWYALIPVWAMLTVFFYSLGPAASAYAYRTLIAPTASDAHDAPA